MGLKPLGFFPAALLLLAAAFIVFAFSKSKPLAVKLSNLAPARLCFLIFIAGLMLRLSVVGICKNEQVSDFQIIHELAQALVEGKGFTYTGPEGFAGDCRLFLNRPNQRTPLPTMWRPPGASLLLASEYLFTGVSTGAGKVLYALFGAAIGVFIFLLVFPANRIAALVAGLLWEMHPGLWVYSLLLGTEIPFTLLICLSAFFLQSSLACDPKKKRGWILLVLCGSAAGISCLVRPQTHQVLCFLFAIVISGKTLSISARRSAIFIAACAIPLLLWSGYNYQRFRTFRFQTTEVGVALFARSSYVKPEHEKQLDTLKRIMWTSTDEIKLDETGKRIAFQRLWIAATKENIIRILWDNHHKVWRNDNEGIGWALRETTGHLDAGTLKIPLPLSEKEFWPFKTALRIAYVTLILLAWFSIFKIDRTLFVRHAGLSALAANLILSTMAFCLFQGTDRYHVALMPMMIIIAGLWIGETWTRKIPQRVPGRAE